jgi:hypothetical protein
VLFGSESFLEQKLSDPNDTTVVFNIYNPNLKQKLSDPNNTTVVFNIYNPDLKQKLSDPNDTTVVFVVSFGSESFCLRLGL